MFFYVFAGFCSSCRLSTKRSWLFGERSVTRFLIFRDTSSQRRAMMIIFAHSDYEMSLMLAGLDTLEERRAQLTERFFRRSVLREGSCLYYLLPDKRDSSVTDRLRRARTFEPLPARNNKFRNSFIPYCLEHFD